MSSGFIRNYHSDKLLLIARIWHNNNHTRKVDYGVMVFSDSCASKQQVFQVYAEIDLYTTDRKFEYI